MKLLRPILCAALLLPAVATVSAQTAADLTGTWREVQRDGTADFTDTTFFTFRTGQEFLRQKAMAFIYRGTYKLSKGTIDMSGMVYKISMKGNRLRLSGDAGVAYFEQYTPGPVVSINNADGSTNRASEAVSHSGLPRIADAAGKWEVFKRTCSEVQQSIDYNRLLKSITLYASPQDGHLGQLNAATDPAGSPSWYITGYSNNTITATGRDSRTLTIVSHGDGELIVEEAPYTYFFKVFQQ